MKCSIAASCQHEYYDISFRGVNYLTDLFSRMSIMQKQEEEE